jgi:hypothetical protein
MVAIGQAQSGRAHVAERRFRAIAAGAASALAIYAAATAAGAPEALLSVVFNVPITVVPALAWWAFRRAPSEQRGLWLLLSLAGTLWLGGTLAWLAAWFADGERVPTPPGPWDVLFIAAYAAGFAAMIVGLRESVYLRHALLDTAMLVAAAVALGIDVLGDRLRYGLGVETLVIVARPALGVGILVLLASAALGSWVGITRGTALVGAGQGAVVAGSIVFSHAALQGRFTDDRWPNVLWAAGAALSALGALTVILGIDRPVVRQRPPLVRASAGATGSLALAALAMAGALAAALSHPREAANPVALAAVGTLVVAAGVRALLAVTAARRLADTMNAEALAAQRGRDALVRRIAELEGECAAGEQELLAIHVVHASFRRVLALRDEETGGQLREQLGPAAWELLMLERAPDDEG